MSVVTVLPKNLNNDYYISFDKWTGQIFKISKQKPILSDLSYIKVNKEDNVTLSYILSDYISPDQAFVGFDVNSKQYLLFKRARTIFLPKAQKTYVDIEETDDADLILTYYTKNKLLDIEINYLAVKKYIKRQIRNFEFARGSSFVFRVLKGEEVLKTFTVVPKKFLETLETTIDLSDLDIEDMSDIKFQTKRVFKNNCIIFKEFKHMDDKGRQVLQKVSMKEDKKKRYHIKISKTSKRSAIIFLCNIDRSVLNRVYKSLDFYFTGKDINEYYGTVSLNIEDLWSRKRIVERIDFEIEGKHIWVNNALIKVNFSEREVKI